VNATVAVPPEAVARIKAQMFYMVLIVLALFVPTVIFHQKMLPFLVVTVGWMSSIFLFAAGRPPYWRIAAVALTQVALVSVFYRLFLVQFFG
jgi:hypothetical protein